LDTNQLYRVKILIKHGPVFLNDEEYSQAMANEMHRYYQYLTKKYIEGGGAAAISFHCEELAKEGIILSKKKLLKALFWKCWIYVLPSGDFEGGTFPKWGKAAQFFIGISHPLMHNHGKRNLIDRLQRLLSRSSFLYSTTLDPLALCLTALSSQTYPQNCYEVIVVDNGSSKNLEIVQACFQKRSLPERKPSGVLLRPQQGNQVPKERYYPFTDSDCIPAVDWIEKGVRELVSSPKCGLVAGRIKLYFKNPEKQTPVEVYESIHAFDQKNMVENYHHGATANVFTYRKVIDDVGLFNADLKSGGDVEWGKRVYAHGYKLIYAADACVHAPRAKWIP
jgi:hypothetical protein